MAIRTFEGSVSLGDGVFVTKAALGQDYHCRISLGTLTLSFPRPREDDDSIGSLRSPHQGDRRVIPYDQGGWGNQYTRPETGDESRRYVVFAASIYIEIEEPSYIALKYFGVEFQEWYNKALQWIEVWTPQLSWLHYARRVTTSGHVIESVDDIGSAWQTFKSPPRIINHARISTNPQAAASPEQLRSAFRRATDNEVPPIAWLTLTNALRTEDPRMAVIEAATAAEIAMSQAIGERLKGVPPDSVSKIILNANGARGHNATHKSVDL